MNNTFTVTDKDHQSPWIVFLIFLRLGLTSFGGPIAHLGYFREEFVIRRRWLSDRSYGNLVALCQFLPGPASSQVGIALGLFRSGYLGALAAWAGFTLPSAFALILFALGIAHYGDIIAPGILQGLKIAAVAVVAQAFWGMARKLCPDILRVTIMAVATCFVLLLPYTWAQIGVLAIAGIAGLALCKTQADDTTHDQLSIRVSHRTGMIALLLLVVMLTGLPVLAKLFPSQSLAMIDAFFRAGALVFGGGHVVLPLLQAEVVSDGWVSHEAFLAGYGAAQAVPGPLFTFASFLGASMNQAPSGWLGGLICLVAIFTPSFLLVIGVIPFWQQLYRSQHAQAALAGINAGVVGLLLAALYQPVWTNTIFQPRDFALALLAFIALMFWRVPPWLVVIGCGLTGWLFHETYLPGL